MDAGRTGAQAQDVRLLLWHCQGQGLTASANPSVKWRLKSGAQRTGTRITHKFVQTQKHANPLKTNGIPQTHRFAGFHFFVRWLQFGYFCFCHLKISMYYKERQSLLIVRFFRQIRSRILQQISYYLIELYCILRGDDRHI